MGLSGPATGQETSVVVHLLLCAGSQGQNMEVRKGFGELRISKWKRSGKEGRTILVLKYSKIRLLKAGHLPG